MKRILSLCITLILIFSLGAVALAEETIQFAVVGPMSGSLATLGEQFVRGAQMKADEINAAGGVDGKQVKLVIYDDKNDAKEAAAIAQNIVADESILGVIGNYSSTCIFAGIPIYEEANMALVTPSASHPDLTKDNSIAFKIWSGFDLYSPKLAELIYSQGYTNVATLYVYNDWGMGCQQYFKERFEELGGTIVAEEVCYDGDKDFKTQLTNIKSKNPDAIMISAYYGEAAIIFQQIETLGLGDLPLYAQGTLIDDQFIEMAGEYAQDVIVVSEFSPDSPKESVQKFVTDYVEKYGVNPTGYDANAYDVVGLYVNAYINAGPTRGEILEGLKTLTNYEGVNGPIAFVGQEVVKDQIYVQLQGDSFVYYGEANLYE